MMTTLESYVRQGRHAVKKWVMLPEVRRYGTYALRLLTGLWLSAASLGHLAQPLVMALVCACSGLRAVLIGVGGMAGYLLFWGKAGLQGVVWSALGILVAWFLADRRIVKNTPLLLPALGALIVAASGVAFQAMTADTTPISGYLLRIGLGGTAVAVFTHAIQKNDPVAKWISWGFGVLALAQVQLLPGFCLGFVASAMLCTAAPFPAAVLSGLALDLAQVTQVPMAAVACLVYLVRLMPGANRYVIHGAPGVLYLAVMLLCGKWDMLPLPGMVVGGALGILLPGQPQVAHRRGETGVAQVRLEMAAGVFAQTQQLLLEAPVVPIDEAAVLARAAERACNSCPCRKSCRDREDAANMPAQLLHRPLLDEKDLPISCRKSGKLLYELHRGQEQLRSIRADRERQREYRAAVVQQYQFLGEYMQDLSDRLAQRGRTQRLRYRAEVRVFANRAEAENGDRCVHFAGVEGKYYVVLCDGMGTGMGAVAEGDTAAAMLKKLLSAGFPAEYALRSINSLCVLRQSAASVTMDVAEIYLNSGKAVIYKWGAAPSYLLGAAGAEKIGTATPPPGLSATGRESAERLSLRRGETLFLVSDGVGGEDALRAKLGTPGMPPGELAAKLLEGGSGKQADDATVVTVRLRSLSSRR